MAAGQISSNALLFVQMLHCTARQPLVSLPQSACFCVLDYHDTGFVCPQYLDESRTAKLLQVMKILSKDIGRQ